MAVVDVDQARNDLSEMVDRVQDGERITITSRNCNAVLISEGDYNSLMETIHILSDPDMAADLDRTRGTPLSEMEVWTQRCRTGRPGRTARPQSEAPSSHLRENRFEPIPQQHRVCRYQRYDQYIRSMEE